MSYHNFTTYMGAILFAQRERDRGMRAAVIIRPHRYEVQVW